MEFEQQKKFFIDTMKKVHAYNHAISVMYYDSQTVAPKNSVQGFADTMGIFSEIQYELETNPTMMDCVNALFLRKDELDPALRREIEIQHKELNRISKIPVEEIAEYSKLQAQSSHIWEIAKSTDDYDLFEPYLAKTIETLKRFASITDPGKDPYEVMLGDYEEGLTTEFLDNFFAIVRERAVALRKRISESPTKIDDSFLKLNYPIEKQRELSDYLMDIMSINRDDCILGEVEHPFTNPFNKHDVRITTHYHDDNMASSLYSVVHEGGHALYELNTGDDIFQRSIASGASIATHESQSRFYENIIGRSESFVELIFPKLKELFPTQLNGVSSHMFYLAVNKTESSLIRTEADELTYPLHIMVRYELEKRLISGELSTKELPAEWNRLYKEYIGIDVPNYKDGVLQDSHWANTMIGYFPSYAVGSAYSAQMLASMNKDMDVFDHVKNNDMKSIVEYMTQKLYKYGMLIKPSEVVEKVCGQKFDPEYYVAYLEKKYGEIYNLD